MKNLFGEEYDFIPHKLIDKERKNWENRFQRWSDRKAQDGATPDGKCGYGKICEYCENNDYGRPCVRALKAYAKNTGYIINYDSDDFYKPFYGR